jgi:hypothetical protein
MNMVWTGRIIEYSGGVESVNWLGEDTTFSANKW